MAVVMKVTHALFTNVRLAQSTGAQNAMVTDPNLIRRLGPGHYLVCISRADRPELELRFARRPRSIWLAPTVRKLPVRISIGAEGAVEYTITDWTLAAKTTQGRSERGVISFEPNPEHACIITIEPPAKEAQ